MKRQVAKVFSEGIVVLDPLTQKSHTVSNRSYHSKWN